MKYDTELEEREGTSGIRMRFYRKSMEERSNLQSALDSSKITRKLFIRPDEIVQACS